MSYKCQGCNCATLSNGGQNKIVVSKREVDYNNTVDEKLKTTHGFETVKEINVCKKCLDKYESTHS